MSSPWHSTFADRMRDFESRVPAKDAISASLKVRATAGCFHREHSPNAYNIIDSALRSSDAIGREFVFEEHESGPEILVYLAVTTAGLVLAKSVIDLVTTIIKARSDGVRKGDTRTDAVELIIRRTTKDGEFVEEIVLKFHPTDKVERAKIEKALGQAAKKLLDPKKRG